MPLSRSNTQSSHTMEESTQNCCKHKQARKSKRVTFSKMSAMLCYEDETSQTDLHYSASDFTQFKQETLDTARQIRTSIEASQASDMKMTQDQAPLKRYTQSWNRLPCLLRDNEIDPQEMIGIEHLVIGKQMLRVNLALRGNSTQMLMEEQHRQVGLRYTDPQQLADTVLPFSKISSYIAYSRVNILLQC